MKKLIATLLCTASLAGSPVKANNNQVSLIPSTAFRSGAHVALAETVNYLGVPIIDGSMSQLPQCQPRQNSKTYGFYVPSMNVMVLCTSNGSLDAMKRTLVHETMHMVQDCRAGLGNGGLKDKNGYLTRLQAMRLSYEHQHNIHHLYEGESQIFEIEARKLENSPKVVYRYLMKYCR